jgi:KUP system potassium uptake protein
MEVIMASRENHFSSRLRFLICKLIPGIRSSSGQPLLSSSADSAGKKPAQAILTLAALGVVFGDIGTSPLYALRECFSGAQGLSGDSGANALGAVSLIIWFLILIVAVKYIVFVMKADNKGEGGILSLMALVHRIGPEKIKRLSILPFFGILGAALLFSDGVITPAISVLSAIEGVSVAMPVFGHLVIPISIAVLSILFVIQSRGTSKVGALFGPVVLLWFVAIAILGIGSILKCPRILWAFSPLYAIALIKTLGFKCFSLLGAAFLSVTGTEVLYADMGHFGKTPIKTAWFSIVFPALILNYLGQGAKLLQLGALPENLFYSLSPTWFLIPLIVIATLATVIASQAVISGAFSLARQSVQLGFWPRMRVVHTSEENIGQVYLPFINLLLFVVTVLLIIGFKESGNLASAYGIAVSATMLITTILIITIARSLWRVHPLIIAPVACFFLLFDISLFAANLSKLLSGGWIVVVMAASVCILMSTWVAGRKILQKSILSEAVPLEEFVKDIGEQKILRTPTVGVFLSGNAVCVPRALLHNYRHNGTLHGANLIACIQTEEVPFVNALERSSVTDFGQGVYKIVLRYGYMESPDVPRDIARVSLPIADKKLNDPARFSYFLGKESLVISKKRSMPFWRKQIFIFLSRNALNASAFFNLPTNRVIELGVQVEF